jgi:hypothetical protein
MVVCIQFCVRARAMVLTGERTLSDTSGERQYCPRARQTVADNYVYEMSGALKNRAHNNAQNETQNYVTPQVCQLLEKHKFFMRQEITSFPMQLHDGTTVHSKLS